MPIYQYECPECGKEIEKLQSFGEPAPLCFHDKLNKLFVSYCSMIKKISKSSFSLKGNNWARDNYGLKKKR